MPLADQQTLQGIEPRCPVCNDTGRAKTETIDTVSMVAWCRCPAGARALDQELARRVGGRLASPREAPPAVLHLDADGDEIGTQPMKRAVAEAQLVAVGHTADERLGVIHVLTLQVGGERIEIPCDRETADAFASSMGVGTLRYRLRLDPA